MTWLLLGAVSPLGARVVLVRDGAPRPVRPVVSLPRDDAVRVADGLVEEREAAFLTGRCSTRRAGTFSARTHGSWSKADDQNKNLSLMLC